MFTYLHPIKKDELLEVKQKEYMKLVIDVPVKVLPTVFQICQEIGLTGEGYYYFITSLDFHGQTDPMHILKSAKVITKRIPEDELRELIDKDADNMEKNQSSFT